MKVIIYSAKDFEMPYLERANNKKHQLTFVSEALNSKTAIKAVGYDAVSIFSRDEATIITLDKLKDFGIKYIALRSAGYDNVNLITAKRLNIKVANAPNYSPFAIAEHAVSLLLALNRKLMESNRRAEHFNFDLNHLIGYDLNNKTVGIIGTGRIGSIMAKIMHGFGCNLLGVDIKKNKELEDTYGLTYVSMKTLCEQADIISIHVPLNGDTHYLINEALIEKMKKGVTIINTARGAVINTEDIIKGLENETIGALGIDVYENEHYLFFKDHSNEILKDEYIIKLNAMPNVLIAGHHAFLTEEALTNIAEIMIYNIDCWNENKDTENELTQTSNEATTT
ncbi:2-hydroxyacid dehydrogenase [Lacinutrix neustonica]|uniref:2-hydroxyacid dehydrogenase n=1 Tax=Lacinutrix neustonica TaxID=2980107 RepID=A0A9E8MWS4_9FLAO|nr:2-hydroxyacid dehydrogenase [Lacinutrix neustonica]WAC02771.1 2-hydroxyacid dehydrogenase [Lacinutrix neustonica]